jgi:hypothetical protein
MWRKLRLDYDHHNSQLLIWCIRSYRKSNWIYWKEEKEQFWSSETSCSSDGKYSGQTVKWPPTTEGKRLNPQWIIPIDIESSELNVINIIFGSIIESLKLLEFMLTFNLVALIKPLKLLVYSICKFIYNETSLAKRTKFLCPWNEKCT